MCNFFTTKNCHSYAFLDDDSSQDESKSKGENDSMKLRREGKIQGLSLLHRFYI